MEKSCSSGSTHSLQIDPEIATTRPAGTKTATFISYEVDFFYSCPPAYTALAKGRGLQSPPPSCQVWSIYANPTISEEIRSEHTNAQILLRHFSLPDYEASGGESADGCADEVRAVSVSTRPDWKKNAPAARGEQEKARSDPSIPVLYLLLCTWMSFSSGHDPWYSHFGTVHGGILLLCCFAHVLVNVLSSLIVIGFLLLLLLCHAATHTTCPYRAYPWGMPRRAYHSPTVVGTPASWRCIRTHAVD